MYNVYLHPSFKMRNLNCLKSINLQSTADNHHHQCTNSRTTFCVSWKLWLNVVTVRSVQNQRKLQPSSGQRGGAFHGQNPLALFSRLGPDQMKSNFKFQNRSLLDVGQRRSNRHQIVELYSVSGDSWFKGWRLDLAHIQTFWKKPRHFFPSALKLNWM